MKAASKGDVTVAEDAYAAEVEDSTAAAFAVPMVGDGRRGGRDGEMRK